MKTQIKQQWIQALRSNEYTQAVGNLQSEQGFCCLGVLCDLYVKETGTEWEVNYTHDNKPLRYYSYHTETAFLPLAVAKWAGLDQKSPIVESPEGNLNELAVLNDSGTSFTQIAQLIEENF